MLVNSDSSSKFDDFSNEDFREEEADDDESSEETSLFDKSGV